MIAMTPVRETIKRRIREIKEQLDHLWPPNGPKSLNEWVALNMARQALEEQLDDQSSSDGQAVVVQLIPTKSGKDSENLAQELPGPKSRLRSDIGTD